MNRVIFVCSVLFFSAGECTAQGLAIAVAREALSKVNFPGATAEVDISAIRKQFNPPGPAEAYANWIKSAIFGTREDAERMGRENIPHLRVGTQWVIE